MKTGKLYGVGIGPGDPQYLTLRAADVLRSVDVVFTVISPNASNSVSQSVVDYLQPRGEVRLQVFSMSRDKTIREEQVRANAEAIIAELRAGHDCAFATLGDAMTYSTFGYVLEIIRKAIPNLDLEVIPGITSFATLTAKAGTVLVENGSSGLFRRSAQKWLKHLIFPRVRRLSSSKATVVAVPFSTGWPARRRYRSSMVNTSP